MIQDSWSSPCVPCCPCPNLLDILAHGYLQVEREGYYTNAMKSRDQFQFARTIPAASRYIMQEPKDAENGQPDEPLVYTMEEFRRRMDASRKAALIVIPVCFAVIFGSLCACAVLFSQFAKELGPPGEPSPLRMGVAVGFLMIIFVICVGMIALAGSVSQKYGVDCKRCGTRLQPVDLNYAIAMHCCPHCQQAMFTEWKAISVLADSPETTKPGDAKFTIAEIEVAERNQRRVFWRCLIETALVAVATFGITSACVWACGGMLAGRFGSWAPDVAKVICVIPASVLFGIGLIWSIRRAQSASPICCQGCGTPIRKERMLRLTGNCQKCGRRVISDAPLLRCDDDPPEVTLIEHAELAAWAAHHRKRMPWWIVIVIGIGGFGWSGLVYWWCGKTGMRDPYTIGEYMTSMAGSLVSIMLLTWLEHRLMLQHCCPYCKRSLLTCTGLVQVTGNCCHCGRRVLASAD